MAKCTLNRHQRKKFLRQNGFYKTDLGDGSHAVYKDVKGNAITLSHKPAQGTWLGIVSDVADYVKARKAAAQDLMKLKDSRLKKEFAVKAKKAREEIKEWRKKMKQEWKDIKGDKELFQIALQENPAPSMPAKFKPA